MARVGEFEQFDRRAVFDYERDADAGRWAVGRNQDFAASKLGGEICHFNATCVGIPNIVSTSVAIGALLFPQPHGRGAESDAEHQTTPDLMTVFGPSKFVGWSSGLRSNKSRSARFPTSTAPTTDAWPTSSAPLMVAIANTPAIGIPASWKSNISESAAFPGSGVSVPRLRRTPAA
jgi:hypothetical protein